MARILNRAYAALNKVLDLAGSQIVSDVDLDQAFPVHDLTAVVQSSLCRPFVAIASHSFAGAGGFNQTLNFYDDVGGPVSVFDIIRIGSQTYQAATADDYPITLEDDIVVTSVAGTLTADQLSVIQFWMADYTGTGAYYPITNELDTTVPLTGPLWAAWGGANAGFYDLHPPFLFTGESTQEIFVRASAAGAADFIYQVHGFVARKGVVARPLVGGR